MVGKPVLHLRQAHVEGIDVPSGDFHADSVCEGRLKSVSGFSGKIRTKQKAVHAKPLCWVNGTLL